MHLVTTVSMMGPFYHAVNVPNNAICCDTHRNLGNDYIKKKTVAVFGHLSTSWIINMYKEIHVP